MEPFSIASELSLADWQAYKRAFAARRQNLMGFWRVFVIAAVLSAGIFALLLLDKSASVAWLVIGAIAAGLAIGVSVRIANRATEAKQRNAFLGPCRFEFSAAGLHVTRPNVEATAKWPYIREIVHAGDHLFLWLEQPAAYVVPLRDLSSDIQRDDAITRIKQWQSALQSQPSSASPVDEFQTKALTETAPTLAKSTHPLGAFLRLLFLRPADARAISGSDGSILLLIALSLGTWIFIDRLLVGPDAEFAFYNFPGLALLVIALLVLCLVLARRTVPNAEFRRVLAVFLAFVPIATVAIVAIDNYLSLYWAIAASLLFFAYSLFYFAKALAVLTGTRQIGAIAAGIFVVAGFWFLNDVTYTNVHMWYSDDEAEQAAQEWSSRREKAEAVMFDQLDHIDEIVASIERPADAVPAFFFVGFAGVGEQRVFAEEIKLAAKVVDERFRVGNRSLLLINDRRDLESQPLASVTGLSYSLQQLATKMNLERDVLFLALSSHGSDAPLLSVSNLPLPLNNLSGEALAAALRDSGIKWRVIVISACYAGAFLDRLKDPNTIVITAAAADKTSFGCSDTRDLTYFGEAFYRDALPKSKSLVQAFNDAKTAIAQREQAEGVTPSDPQAFFGDELRRKLEKP